MSIFAGKKFTSPILNRARYNENGPLWISRSPYFTPLYFFLKKSSFFFGGFSMLIRLYSMNEKVIKYFGGEPTKNERVSLLRDAEVNSVLREDLQAIRNVCGMFSRAANPMGSMYGEIPSERRRNGSYPENSPLQNLQRQRIEKNKIELRYEPIL
jgi:hypothetical protein